MGSVMEIIIDEKRVIMTTVLILVTMIICFSVSIRGVDAIEVFEREDKPNAMRIFRTGADSIFMEDSTNVFSISFEDYLDTFENVIEREKERKEVELLVKWY